jgi:hypothetical protein
MVYFFSSNTSFFTAARLSMFSTQVNAVIHALPRLMDGSMTSRPLSTERSETADRNGRGVSLGARIRALFTGRTRMVKMVFIWDTQESKNCP